MSGAQLRREGAVDGLRGLMLLVIVITHYVPTGFFSGNIARPAAAIMLAVTGYFFMRVSELDRRFDGSLLERARAAARTFAQRHMRIWPVIAGVILMYVALGYVDPSPTTTQIHDTWPYYLAYLGNVVKMMLEGQAFPAHFWLISAQEQFVLLALIAMVLLGRAHVRNFLIAMVVVGVGSRILGGLIWMPEHPALATETPFAVADALSLGMLCRIAISEGASKTRMRRSFLVAALVTFVLWSALPNTYAIYFGLVPLITALIGCLIILVLADEVRVRRFERAMLSWPAVVLLGQMSLSLFLLHPFVNTIINLAYARQTGEVIPWWLLSMAGPPISVLVAYCYFRTVEVPIRRYRSRSAAKRPRPIIDERSAARSQAAGSIFGRAGLEPARS